LAKTIAVDESAWRKLRELTKEEGAKDFDHMIIMLIERSKEIPRSIFGVDINPRSGSRRKNMRRSLRTYITSGAGMTGQDRFVIDSFEYFLGTDLGEELSIMLREERL